MRQRAYYVSKPRFPGSGSQYAIRLHAPRCVAAHSAPAARAEGEEGCAARDYRRGCRTSRLPALW